MAIRWTAKAFEEEFGKKIGALVDVTKHVTERHKIEAMQSPGIATKRYEFGKKQMSPAVLHHYMIEVRWWFDTDVGRFRGKVLAFTLYEDPDEQMAAMANAEKNEVPPFNVN